jgi:hypothetical protein
MTQADLAGKRRIGPGGSAEAIQKREKTPSGG